MRDINKRLRRQTTPTQGGSLVAPPASAFGRRYTKGRLLGTGSMGIVFSAFDRKRGHYVACKTIRADAPQRHHEALRTEANLLKSLDHKGILPLYDIGSLPDGRPFYTMKRVQGETLEDALKHGTLTLGQGIDALQQACSTLAYAHKLGVVHCDLKPGNILRDNQGQIYVIDWGTSESRVEGAKSESTKKKKYIVNGTPLYIAPEVLRGEEPSPAADQYAIGVILYELLTKSFPFYDDNAFTLFQKVCCTEAIPPHIRAKDAHVPVAIEAICMRLLTKFASTRYADCHKLGSAFDQWLVTRTLPIPAPSKNPGWFAAPA